MKYTVYNVNTGIPTGVSYEGDYETVMLSLSKDEALFEGYLNQEYDRVNLITKEPIFANQLVIDRYNNTRPNEFHSIWDKANQKWLDLRTPEDKLLESTKKVLSIRAVLLLESDWTQLPNSPLTSIEINEWANYRQSLRDITLQSEYPDNIIWPTKPT